VARYVLQFKASVDVRDETGELVGTHAVEGTMALASGGRQVGTIIDSITEDQRMVITDQAKLIVQRSHNER
jgi:hypothetical protein